MDNAATSNAAGATPMDFSDAEQQASTTTISTVAVQAGKAKIVLAILRSHDWIRVRIQQMEPDLMEVGSSLEESMQLRREHDELLYKLNLKQKDVQQLLSQVDDLANENRPQAEVYQAMSDSLNEAWKDLNTQLEYRKMLLDQSIAFHQSANQFATRMGQAQDSFSSVGLAQDVDTARRLLQQHQDIKKHILESSMHTLQEGQALLDRIREMGMHADVQNRHATTAACYGIEQLLEQLQDRRRRLEDLWLQRKIKLEQHLQLLLLDLEINKVSEWYSQVGDTYLNNHDLGDSFPAAQALHDKHIQFEQQAREIQDTVVRLLRTADQLVHSAHYNADAVTKRLRTVDSTAERFMQRLDTRRTDVTMALTFFSYAQTALMKLDEIEAQLSSTDLPRNSSALADQHAFLANAIVEASTPALREGRSLLERVRRGGDAGAKEQGSTGVQNKLQELQDRCAKLQDMCLARYEAGERSQAFNQFQDKFNNLATWLGQIVAATLGQHGEMGSDYAAARDFLQVHVRLDTDIKAQAANLAGLGTAVEELQKAGEAEAQAAADRVAELKKQWEQLHQLVQHRIRLAQSYVAFHKKAQNLAVQMDALEQYLKIEKMDPTQITEGSIKHKESKYGEMSSQFSEVENKGKAFIKEAQQASDEGLNTRHAIIVVETIISQFTERKFLVTEYYEHWKVHVTTGKEFKSQWHQFVQDARKTIDWVMEIERDLFVPYIAGTLGKNKDEAMRLQKKVNDYMPTAKKAQEDIEKHLKTAEMLALKGDTHGQRDQIVNELLKVHTRFQGRITEYQVLLNMTLKFYGNLDQLDRLIETTVQQFETQTLPEDVTQAQMVLKDHELKRHQAERMIEASSTEGEQIVVRVRQQDSEAIAKDEVQKVLQETEKRRRLWEQQWDDQKNKLEQNVQVCQFYFDLRQIHSELDELHRQLAARKGSYGSSLSSVVMTSDAFKTFEQTVGVIEKKIKTFVSTADMMIRDHHYDSRRIRHEVDEVQRKWAAFFITIGDYRSALDVSKRYFELQDECEKEINDASQTLLTIGRRATECKTSEDANCLIKELDDFKNIFGNKQDARLGEMEKIAVELWGPVQGPAKMQHILDKNQEILNSFLRAIDELGILRENLIRKETILAEMNTVVETHAPHVPRFVVPLQNAEIMEGQKFTFECRLQCDTKTPKIEWFKDEMPLTSPDYLTAYKDGVCMLTIEETFAEDSAKYTCKATTDAGTAETTSQFKVRETHQKVAAPNFSKQLKSAEVPEGTQYVMECIVAGIPAPTVSWFKDDECLDANADYVMSRVNNVCTLKIRRLTKAHSARYSCKANNPGGEAASACRIDVISIKKPFFDQPLCNASVPEGQGIRLECGFQAEPAPQITWLKDNVPIHPSNVINIVIEGNFTALEISQVFSKDAGTYTVVAKNIGGEGRTACMLTIEGSYPMPDTSAAPMKPRFTQPLQNRSVQEGARARLDCVAVAVPEPEIIWYHNERPVKESKDFQLLFEGDRCSLLINEVYLEDSGEYKCEARNQQGSAQSSCRLIVDPLSELSDVSNASASSDVVPPKFTQLLKDMEGPEGSSIRFDCRVIGHPTPQIKWYKGRQKIESSADFQLTSSRELYTLTIPEVFAEDAGNFMVKASNAAGEAKCYATLTVRGASDKHMMKTRLVETSHTQRTGSAVGHEAPQFIRLFKDMRVRPGESCRLEVLITGSPRPSVYWLFNNEPVVSPDYQISSAGDTYSLYIPEVFDEDAGRFSVTAENDSGKATCSALLVIVDEEQGMGEIGSPPETPIAKQPPAGPFKHDYVKPTVIAPVARAPPPPPAPKPAPVAAAPPPPPPPAPKPAPVAAPPPPPPAPKPVQDKPVPPKFSGALKNTTVEEGKPVTFEATFEGKPPPTIKWFKEGQEITAAPDYKISAVGGRATLTIPEVFAEDAGKYFCRAISDAGEAHTFAELIVKTSAQPPRFVSRLEQRHAHEGEQVRLIVRVTGKPAPNVTWYREDAKIVSSADFQLQQDGDTHALLIPEVFAEDAGKFTAKAENEAGEDTTTARLTVEAPAISEEEIFEDAPAEPVHAPPPPPAPAPPPPAPPTFQKQLNNINAKEGHRVVLECRVPAYPEPQRVQWFRNEVEIHTSPDYEISYNAGVCTLVISECFPEDSGKFTCTITVSGVSNSTTMFLKVDAAPEPVAPPPPPPPPPQAPRQPETQPVFVQPLGNQPIKFGGTAHFECRVQGHPPPEILWTRKGHPLVDKTRYKSTYDQYSGTTTLTILDLRAEDEGEYTCTAINSQGEVSTGALLLGPDRYAAWLAEQRGEPAPKKALLSELEHRLESPRPPAQQQQQQQPQPYRPMSEPTDTRLSDTEGFHPDEGFKVSSFEQRLVTEIEYRDGKVAPHLHDANEKEAFDSSVPTGQAAAPVFDQRLSDFQLMEGSDVTFMCKVSGNPRPFIQWYQNGRPVRPSQRYEARMTKDGYVSLRIRTAFPEDRGHYTCCATNIAGRDTCSAELFVEGIGTIDETSYVNPDTLRRIQRSPALKRDAGVGGVSEKHFRPVFRKVPGDVEVPEGKMCRLDCVVSGRPMPELFWYRDDQQVHSDDLHKIVVNEDGIHSLIIHATYPNDAGQYTCIARNKGGEDRFTVHLNVLPRDVATQPQFTERLPNQGVREGQPVTFIAYVQGIPPPMLSWQRDGKHIDPNDTHYTIEHAPGQSTLHIPCPDARDNAWFQCTAASKGGTATTRARLTVQPEARKPEPERKLVIPKKTTPTPKPEDGGAKRPSLEPSQTARANLVLTPSPQIQPEPVQPAFTQPPPQAPAPRRRPVDEPDFIQPEQAPAAFQAPAPPPSKANINLAQPDSGLRDLVKQEDQSAPPARPPTQQLIQQGVEPAPPEEDMFNKDAGRPPKFKVPLRSHTDLVESQRALFETRLVPIGDPDMKVEWYKDGTLLRAGHRFVTTYDFGYVSLELLWTYPEDNGAYSVVATNKYGQDQTHAEIRCFGKESVIYDSQLPEGSESVQNLYALEESIRRSNMPRERPEEEAEPAAPVFDLMPEAVQCEEGDTAKFMCKVGGHPRPRVTWWVNGAIIVNGHRFVLRYDGMIHVLEIPKAREYDNGTVRVVAKNPLGEAECSTTLVVVPREDWRSRLRQAPKSTVEVELAQKRNVELRSMELTTALKKPKTTVVEIRAFERSAQEKFQQYKDDEVKQAYQTINTRHAQMNITEASHELRMHEPNVHIESEVHRERAKHMLGLMSSDMERKEPPRIPRSQKSSEPPTITKPLMNVNAKEGQAVKMEVNFKGFPTPEVQWFREGVEIQSSRDFQITSLNNKSFLLIPEVFLEDAGTYTIRTTNAFGMMECNASLKVKEDTTKVRETAPEFRVQMHDLDVNIGEPATFDVQVSGTPRPQVYWTKDGRRIPQSPRWKFIVEEDHFTYLIFEVRAEDQGLYEVVVMNKMGKATCSARLSAEGVQPTPTQQTFAAPPPGSIVAPQLVTPMKDCIGNEGDSAAFQCVITGNPEPVIQWYYDNQVIKPSKYFLMHSENGVHTLQIAGAFPEDEGVYKCVARNQGGEVTCIAHLKVLGKTLSSEAEPDLTKGAEAPRFMQPIQSMDVKDGQSARFEAVVNGTPPPQVTWFREGIQIPNSQDFQIVQDGNRSILFIREVLPEDSGIFTCRLTNAAGVAECSAELFVEDTKSSQAKVQLVSQKPKGPSKNKPQILKAPSPVREVVAGNTTKLIAQIAAEPPPRFTWYVNGMQIKSSQRHKVSYDNGIITLIIFNVQVADSGEYMLKATNELGETTCKTTLNIMPSQKVVQLPAQTKEVQITTTTKKTTHISKTEVAPVFVQPLQPEIRAEANNVARLECQLQAYPIPTVTWHVNGVQIKPSPKHTIHLEGEKSVLLIKHAQPKDSGVYSCRAVSELGEAVSSTTLYITSPEPEGVPPKFVSPLKNQVADDGKEVIFNCQVTGVPSPDIFWFHNDKSIDKSEDFVINYERKTGKIELVIVDCLPDDSGTFKCIARNNAGEDLTAATLTVNPAPKPPQPMQVQEDVVMPEAAPQAQSKVKKDVQQTAVVETVRKESVESISSSTSSSKDVRVIKKVVKRTSGQPPRFSKPIQPQVVREGDTALFSAVVTGAPQPDIIWLKDKVEMKPSDHFVMEFEPNTGMCALKILNAQAPDVGVYSCRAQNAAGRATCTANVVVVPPDAEVTVTEKTVSVKKEKVTVVGEEETRVVENSPTFTQPLMPQTEANEGDTVQLTCQVECEPSPKVSWYHNSKEIISTSRTQILFDVTTRVTTLTIQKVTKPDEGDYVCRATNPLGEGTTRTVLHIKGKQPVRAPAPLSAPVQQPVGETPIMPESQTPAQAGVPASQPPAEVPPAPMTEPCAVISKEPEAPRFTLPLRDQQVNDGDKAIFKVFFRGNPSPSVTWFFNSQPIKPSRDFQINVDIRRGESSLVIVEVFPEDEGEYMCKAENTMGAAVTHCHLFVRLPSSSSGVSDEEVEKITSRTTETVTTIEPISIKEQRRFSETIAIDHKQKFKQMELKFGLPEPKISRTEMKFQQPATPRGIKMEVEVPHISSEKVIELKQRAEALMTQRQTLALPISQQRRFSETIAIDHTRLQPVELQINLPRKQQVVSKSSLTVQKPSQPKGVKMEVELPSFRQELSTIEIQKQKQVLAMEIQRQEFQMQLMGKPPRFVWQLNSLKVMDGEEARFVCKVTGNPMPEVSWYHNGKLVVDNPDFKTAYDKNTGECILHILEVFPQDTGKYECVATNKYGKAVTKATLLVEVFEYVPDSEEATASQTESIISSSSVDEVEFQKKTQKFLENMETLRKEIQEDITETEYQEEIVEELEIEEQGYEETIQMADVKWQFQKRAVAEEMRTSPERAIEVISAFRPEQPAEEEIQRDIVTAVTHKKRLSQVRPIHQQVSEEATQEIYATGADSMKHEDIQVELAHHGIEPNTETMVQPQVAQMPVDTHEELAPEVTEESEQQEIAQVQYTQPAAPKKPETRVEAMTEEVPVEAPQEIIAEGALESEQQEIPQIEMMQPVAPKKPETRVEAMIEEVPVEAPQDIIAEGALESEQQEIPQIEMMQPVAPLKTESRVEAMVEEVPVEAPQDIIAEGALESEQQEIAQIEMEAPLAPKKPESRVVATMEEVPVEAHQDIIAEGALETEQEEIPQVQMEAPLAPGKTESRVVATMEEVPVEAHEDIVAEGALETEQQDIPVVEMEAPLAPKKTETRVEATLEEIPVEAPQEIVAEGTLETEHKEIPQADMEAPLAPQKTETMVQAVVEDVQMEVHEELVSEGALYTEQEEIQQAEMAQPLAPIKTETHVTPQTEQLPEETFEEARSVSPDAIQEELVSTDVVDGAQASVSDFRAEAQQEEVPEETAAVITEEFSTETTQQEEITVEMATHDVHAATGAMVIPQEEVIAPEDTQDITEAIPDAELTQGQDVVYDIVNQQVSKTTETRVESVLEILSEGNIEEELAALVAEQMAEEETQVNLESGVQTGKPMVNVDVVEEKQQEEEDEEFFYEAPEPAVEGQDVPTVVNVIETKTKAEMLTLTLEAHQDVEQTEESQIEFTEEVPSEEKIIVKLEGAEKEEALPTMVQPQLQITEPLQTDELTVEEVSEDRTEESQVTVTLTTADKEQRKPSLVGDVEELIEVQETRSDVTEITEEFTQPDEVHVDLAVPSQDEKPETLVRPISEGQAPEHVEQELEGNIKEVYLVPGFVAPTYEPSVVEKFRFEAHVQPRHGEHHVEQTAEHVVQMEVKAEDKTEVVEHLAARMAQSIVRAVQEVTEEQEHVTEVVTEEVEVMKKPVDEAIMPEELATVQAAPKKLTAKQLMAPVFEIPLSDVTISDGERAVLEARVTGVPQPVVTWYVDAQEIKPSADFKMTYEDGVCMLEIVDALPEDEGEYTIKAVNEAGTCVTTAYLTILPSSESEPESPAVEPQIIREVTTVVKASGEKVIEEKQKVEIDVSVTTKKEKHRSTVEIQMPSSPQAPTFVSKLQQKEIFESMPVTLECHVTSNPEANVAWFKDNKKLTSTKHIQLDYQQGRCTLAIDKVTLEDEAEYKCEARNELGVSTTITELLVEKLIGAVEQVISEEYYEVDIELHFKWRPSESEAALLATHEALETPEA